MDASINFWWVLIWLAMTVVMLGIKGGEEAVWMFISAFAIGGVWAWMIFQVVALRMGMGEPTDSRPSSPDVSHDSDTD